MLRLEHQLLRQQQLDTTTATCSDRLGSGYVSGSRPFHNCDSSFRFGFLRAFFAENLPDLNVGPQGPMIRNPNFATDPEAPGLQTSQPNPIQFELNGHQ